MQDKQTAASAAPTDAHPPAGPLPHRRTAHCRLPHSNSSLTFICLTKLIISHFVTLARATIKHTSTSKLYQQGKEDSGGNNGPPSLSYVNKDACFITTIFQSHFDSPNSLVFLLPHLTATLALFTNLYVSSTTYYYHALFIW